MKTVTFEIGLYHKGTPVYLIRKLEITEKDLYRYIVAAQTIITLMEENGFQSSSDTYLAFDYHRK